MSSVGVRELKAHTSEILRRVREQGEVVEVTHRGEVVARLVPAGPRRSGLSAHDAAILANLRRLGAEISKEWPPDLTAEEAVKEQRREL